ncbi:MAG: hypothetical protein ACOYMP_01360 [Nodosilinea sp.]
MMDLSGTEPSPSPAVHSYSSQSNRHFYLMLALALVLAALGGSGLKFILNHYSAPSHPAKLDHPESSTPIFQAHLIPGSALPLADPALLPSTPVQARLTTVATGRVDPFTSILAPGRGGLPQALKSPSASAVLPTVTLPAPGSVAPLLTPPPVGVVPGPLVRTTDAMSGSKPISLIDQIGINGIAQVGNQVSVIVTEPGRTAGRRVLPGEALVDGQVRLKQVDLSGAEPQIVLTYGNQDYYRPVGAGPVMGQR